MGAGFVETGQRLFGLSRLQNLKLMVRVRHWGFLVRCVCCVASFTLEVCPPELRDILLLLASEHGLVVIKKKLRYW